MIAWRKNRFAKTALAGLTLLGSATMALASSNLLTNGNFEASSAGWTSRTGGATLETSTSTATYGIPAAPAGSRFCEVEAGVGSPTTTPDYIQQSVTSLVGERYFVSIQATTRAATSTLDRMIIYADGTNLASIATGNTWVAYQSSFVATAASSVIRYISNGSATGTIQPGDGSGLIVDDAQVQELTVSGGALSTAEDVTLAIPSLQVATNTGLATLTVSLSVSNGILTLASTTGLTITSGANASSAMTFTGTAAAINTAFGAGVSFKPTADYNGAAALTFTTTAGAVSDTDTVAITVTPVVDIVADSVTTPMSTAIIFNAITGTNGANADNFENTPSITAVGSASHGSATFTAAGVITYTPTAGYTGTDTFTYTVASGGVTEVATETVTMTGAPTTLTLTKISNGGTGTFTFTGNNGWTSQGITTLVAGTGVPGVSQILTNGGVATTITESPAAGFGLASVSCTGMGTGGTATVSGLSFTLNAAAAAGGSTIACTVTNSSSPARVTTRKISNGGVATFNYTGTNGLGAQAITTVTPGTAVSATQQSVTAFHTVTRITEAATAGYALVGISCTGTGAGNTSTSLSAGGGFVDLAIGAIVPGAAIVCTFTNTRAVVKVSAITNGAVGGPFTFTQSNLASNPPNITTVATGTATPASPSNINLTTLGTAVQITETPALGFALTAAGCTDANSVITGNSGTFGTLSGNTLTIANTNIVAGTDLTCTFTNTRSFPTITLTKISNGGIGGFTFTGNNGWVSQTINTATAGVGVAGVTQALSAAGTATTITETLGTAFIMSGATCANLGAGGNYTVNTATGAIAFDAAAMAATANITCTVTNAAANPLMTVTKTSSVPSIAGAGAVITYSMLVTNTGNVPVSAITVADPLGTPLCPTSGNATIATLAVGGSETCTMSYTVPQAVIDNNGGGDGDIDNTAAATGSYAASPVTANGSAAITFVQNASLEMVKSANQAGPLTVGMVVTYSYLVRNTGNVTISAVTASDVHNGSGPLSAIAGEVINTDVAPLGDSTDAAANGSWDTLRPGDTIKFTATYTVTQTDIDTL